MSELRYHRNDRCLAMGKANVCEHCKKRKAVAHIYGPGSAGAFVCRACFLVTILAGNSLTEECV